MPTGMNDLHNRVRVLDVIVHTNCLWTRERHNGAWIPPPSPAKSIRPKWGSKFIAKLVWNLKIRQANADLPSHPIFLWVWAVLLDLKADRAAHVHTHVGGYPATSELISTCHANVSFITSCRYSCLHKTICSQIVASKSFPYLKSMEYEQAK